MDPRRPRRLAAHAAIAALLIGCGLATPAFGTNEATGVPSPLIEDPVVSGGMHFQPATGYSSLLDLGTAGYVEREYFMSGTARTVGSALPTGPAVHLPVTTAPYKTRLLVRRPANPRRFNGTVVVDWFNVTAGQDFDPAWIWSYPEFIREGYAYVGVSAQLVGVNALRTVLDPPRYHTLSHPGDQFSMDIFSQALKAIRKPSGVNILPGLRAKRLFATGESQSAARLHDYIDLGLQRDAKLADGFLLNAGGDTVFTNVQPDVPVLHFRGEEQAIPGPRLHSKHYRIWWVAGASHVDAYSGAFLQAYLPAYFSDDRNARFDSGAARSFGERGGAGSRSCGTSPNVFPARYALDAAFHALDSWVRTGVAPRNSPEFVYTPDASRTPTPFGYTADGTVVRDAYGNVKGGLRLPVIDVPVAQYRGNACMLVGYSIPFSDLQLRTLYPRFADYHSKLEAAAARAVAARYLRPADADDILERACGAMFRWPSAPVTAC